MKKNHIVKLREHPKKAKKTKIRSSKGLVMLIVELKIIRLDRLKMN